MTDVLNDKAVSNGHPSGTQLSSGVGALITKLRNDGVAAGQAEAVALVDAAKAEAEQIVAAAKADSDSLLSSARKQADDYRNAGEAALKTAMRDAVLGMKAGIMDHFSSDVKRLISQKTREPDIVRDMILAVAGNVRESTGTAQEEKIGILVPAEVMGLEELRDNPEELEHGRLTGFVQGITADMLREGVELSAGENQAGIRVKVRDRDIEIDLSDEAVANLLLKHIQPRFRAVLEGIVR